MQTVLRKIYHGASWGLGLFFVVACGAGLNFDPTDHVERLDTSAPTAGAFTAATDLTDTSFTLNWTAASDDQTATSDLEYLVCSATSAAMIDSIVGCESATTELDWSPNILSLALSGKSASTAYHFNVLVKDSAGNRTLYEGQSQTTAVEANAPTVGAFTATTGASSTGLTLHWTAALDDSTATSDLVYQVCQGLTTAAVDTIAECEDANLGAYSANLTSFGVTGLAPVTTYYFNVVVKDEAGNRALYPGISEITDADTSDPVPGVFTASTGVGYHSFTIHWTAAVDDITSPSDLEYFFCWGASPTDVDTVTECENATVLLGWTANQTSLFISVAPATTYHFNVLVRDSAGNRALYPGITQSSLSDTTPPTVTTLSPNTSVGYHGFTVNWSSATDDLSSAANLEYLVCVDTHSANVDDPVSCPQAATVQTWTTLGTGSLSAVVTGLIANTDYHAAVMVRDEAGNIAIYSPIPQHTAVDETPPTGGGYAAATGVSYTGFTLNWNAATDDLSAANTLMYFVCSGNSLAAVDAVNECVGGSTTSEMGWTTNVTTLTITGKTPGVPFYYNVAVKDEAGNVGLYGSGDTVSTTADVTAPSAGTWLPPSGVGTTSFTLNWTAASDDYSAANALEYLVCEASSSAELDTIAECENATIAMNWTANTTTVGITGKSTATTYFYNILVRDQAGNQALYPFTSVITNSDTTDPVAGSFAATTSVTYTSFTLNWTAASDDLTAANSLEYLVCTANSPFSINSVAGCESSTIVLNWSTATLSLPMSGLVAGTDYHFNVLVRDAAGNKGAYSGITQPTAYDSTPPTVGAFAATTGISYTDFTLHWTSGTDDYDGSNVTYYVCSGPSVASIDSVSGCESQTTEMTWSAGTTSLAIFGKSPATEYYYNVLIKDSAGNKSAYPGLAQSTLSDTTAPTAGAFNGTTGVTYNDFTINWSAASDDLSTQGSLQYFVCSGASAAAVDTASECVSSTMEMNWATNTLTLPITGKTPATTYYYNVVARDEVGNQSIYPGLTQSTDIDDTAPSAGGFTAATGIDYTGFTINWTTGADDLSAGMALEYLVCSSEGAASDLDTLAECEAAAIVMNWSANTLFLAQSGKTPNTTYYYNVVVRDEAGNKTLYAGTSVATSTDTTDPTASSFAATSSISNTGFTLNWNAATDDLTGASALEYLVCTGADLTDLDTVNECENATIAMNWTANTVTLPVTGKAAGTTYYYNVAVRDEAGNVSMYPGIAPATTADVTAPTAGSFSAATSITNTSFTLNWSAATDNVTAANDLEYYLCSGASLADIDTDNECLSTGTMEMNWTAATLSKGISGLAAGTTYYFNVVVKDAAGNTANYGTGSYTTTAPFTSVWYTDAMGGSTNNSQVQLPLVSSGSYNFTVDWGDGSSDTITSWNQPETTHTYALGGTKTIQITGTINGWSFAGGGDATKIEDIQNWGALKLGNQGYYFAGASNLAITATDDLDLSSTTTLEGAFQDCSNITTIPSINSWSTSQVTNLSYVFKGASSFNSNIAGWNVSNATTMRSLFEGAAAFNQDISNWDVSLVTNMESMFADTTFNGDISQWDVSSVTNMQYLFANNSTFNQDISAWDVSNVTQMAQMFLNSAFDQNLGAWDVSNVIDMQNMFFGGMLSQANYDGILTGWSAQALQSSVTFSAGGSTYSAGGATTARDILTGTFGWTVSDGGQY